MSQQRGGLAAQPVSRRPGRGRTGLRPSRTARQRQRRRPAPRHDLAVAAQGLPTARAGHAARNPEAVRQRAIATASRRAGQPAAPTLDPVFVALNQSQLPAPCGAQGEQGVRLRCAEEIETLSYRTVVELNAGSRLAPQRRVATIARRPERAQRLASERAGHAGRRQLERTARTDRLSRPQPQPERGMAADAR